MSVRDYIFVKSTGYNGDFLFEQLAFEVNFQTEFEGYEPLGGPISYITGPSGMERYELAQAMVKRPFTGTIALKDGVPR